jgi:Protein of unknown function (DUF1524)
MFSIEHVLPEAPDLGWEQFGDADHEAFVYRLGNMTLMNVNDNREIGNAPFDVKKVKYADSKFEITRKIATDNSEWTMARIAERQQWMAKQATAIWRIAQLG